ncbi:type I-C CRISPR-associated endonuclease Cas1c [Halothiobacillus neapolitanus]|uniref:CRISPR-associated endonuclease Cas1 n=1 Tax=Halothiobacillus neapolitanus (strain ATCC 23641 / DSM 15147 / CIP 104769 / NCIMB 8539 / c2) TaxID=555778 RepID=D0KYZ2_HALNC|nr:type I-C CRISPR-associated endonuclease Cas1c [Halothiobacillus neapolitanus]ACX95665.1 CRISPR-associated protein Cas1 [Halothiobacillus neapolitanus c2]TDN65970.1 CRISPR-associated Cas1 family protein [Halothiobacillus neapolitanus]
MHTVQNTLYIMTPNAYVHLENATVRIDVEREKKLQVPLHHLNGLVCFGNIMISPALMHRLADDGKSLVLMDSSGRFKARLEGPVSGNILLRQAHHRQASDAAFALEIARTIVSGKLKNSRSVVQRGARETSDTIETTQLTRSADNLAASLRAAAAATSMDELRGIEGEAARGYFSAINLIVKTAMRANFQLNGRTRRPPLDRFNALISFLYAMLMNDCRSAIEATGLDAQLGFLHAVRPGRAALALDLMEEFRAIAADRLALTLINRGQINASDFDEREGGAVMLNDRGRRAVVTAWQERKQEIVTHPLTETKIPIGLLPFIQARFLARTIRGEMDGYLPYQSK